MEYSTRHLNFLGVYQESTSDNWNFPWNTKRKRCITTSYHAIKKTTTTIQASGQNYQYDLRATHDRKVG